jgi:gas vesicle protein
MLSIGQVTDLSFVWVVPLNRPERKENMNTNSQELEPKEKKSSTILSALTGLVVGSVAGAVTILLFAPQPGEKTRAELKDGVSDLRHRTAETVNDKLTQVKSKASQIKADVQIKAQDLQHQGQDLLAKQLDRVSHAAEEGKKMVQASQN